MLEMRPVRGGSFADPWFASFNQTNRSSQCIRAVGGHWLVRLGSDASATLSGNNTSSQYVSAVHRMPLCLMTAPHAEVVSSVVNAKDWLVTMKYSAPSGMNLST